MNEIYELLQVTAERIKGGDSFTYLEEDDRFWLPDSWKYDPKATYFDVDVLDSVDEPGEAKRKFTEPGWLMEFDTMGQAVSESYRIYTLLQDTLDNVGAGDALGSMLERIRSVLAERLTEDWKYPRGSRKEARNISAVFVIKAIVTTSGGWEYPEEVDIDHEYIGPLDMRRMPLALDQGVEQKRKASAVAQVREILKKVEVKTSAPGMLKDGVRFVFGYGDWYEICRLLNIEAERITEAGDGAA